MITTKNGEKIPTLKEVLNLVNGKTKLYIELKTEGTAQAVASIFNVYFNSEYGKLNDFIISSYIHKELEIFNKIYPKAKLGILILDKPLEYLLLAKKLNAYSLNLPLGIINKKVVEQIHKHNLKVFAYTANSKTAVKTLSSLGVDGVFSDFPDIVR